MADKKAYKYFESIVYLFVNVEKKNDWFIIYGKDFCDVINYVEHCGMTNI